MIESRTPPSPIVRSLLNGAWCLSVQPGVSAGAAGADESTGDGAGILLQIPHEFFAAEATGTHGRPLPGPIARQGGSAQAVHASAQVIRLKREAPPPVAAPPSSSPIAYRPS